MKTTNVVGRMLVVALTILVLADCHSRLPRPGKPTAPHEQSQREHPTGWERHIATDAPRVSEFTRGERQVNG